MKACWFFWSSFQGTAYRWQHSTLLIQWCARDPGGAGAAWAPRPQPRAHAGPGCNSVHGGGGGAWPRHPPGSTPQRMSLWTHGQASHAPASVILPSVRPVWTGHGWALGVDQQRQQGPEPAREKANVRLWVCVGAAFWEPPCLAPQGTPQRVSPCGNWRKTHR